MLKPCFFYGPADSRPWSAPSGAFGSATAQRAALRQRQSSRASLYSLPNLLTVTPSSPEFSTPIHSSPPSPTVPRASPTPLLSAPPPQRALGSPHLTHSTLKSPDFTFKPSCFPQSTGTAESPQKLAIGGANRATRSPVGHPVSPQRRQPLRGRQPMANTGMQPCTVQQFAEKNPTLPQTLVNWSESQHDRSASGNDGKNGVCCTRDYSGDCPCGGAEGGLSLQTLTLRETSPGAVAHPAVRERPHQLGKATEAAVISGCSQQLGLATAACDAGREGAVGEGGWGERGADAGRTSLGSWAGWEDESRQVMDWAGMDVEWLRSDLLPYAESMAGSPTYEASQMLFQRKGPRYGWHQHYRV
jgi:hypothetical protein